MKGRSVLIEPRPDGGAAAALMVDGRLEDLAVDPDAADPTPRPEAVHLAQAARPMKGMGGATVDLGGGGTGFLRTAKPPAPGARVLVQVAGWAEPGKAPPVSARVTLKGAFAVLTPGAPGLNLSRAIPEGPEREALAALAAEAMSDADPGLGLILRSLAADAPAAQVLAEIARLREDWIALEAAGSNGPPRLLRPAPGAAEVARREWRVGPDDVVVEHAEALAEAGVWETITALLRPVTSLGAGGLAIEATRALVAVDVNTGGDFSPAAALKANLAAARELPRALRLRGLGGQVVIDFAPLAKRDRPRIEAALRAALRLDDVETSLVGWTPLGHLELLRRRARRPLSQLPLRAS